jgi:hypothetical protein
MPYRFLLPSASSVVAVSAIVLFANATPASAYEYCRRDVTGFMLGCSFETLEQCYATESGIGVIASTIHSGRRPKHSHPRRTPCT